MNFGEFQLEKENLHHHEHEQSGDTLSTKATDVHKYLMSLCHDDKETQCDTLIRNGVGGDLCDMLCKCLLCSIPKDEHQISNTRDIFIVLHCLEFLHRCCSESVLKDSFHEIGHAQLLPLLLEILEVNSSLSDEGEKENMICSFTNQFTQSIINMSLKIIYHFSQLNDGHRMMGRQRGYIDSMSKILSQKQCSTHEVAEQQWLGNSCLVIRILMTYDQKHALVRCSTFLDSIMQLVDRKSRAESAKELCELVAMFSFNIMEEDVQNQLYLINVEGFLAYIVDTIEENCDEESQIRACSWQALYLAKALCLLSQHEANVEQIVCYKNGKVIEVLRKMIINDIEASRVTKVVYNITNFSEVARSQFNNPEFIAALAIIALSQENLHGEYAVKAVQMILCEGSPHHVFQKTILILSKKSNFCLSATLEIISDRMRESKSSMVACIEDKCVVKLIMDTIKSGNCYCIDAVKVLHYLCSEPECLNILRRDPLVLETLASISDEQESLLAVTRYDFACTVSYMQRQELASLASICYCNLLSNI